MEQTDRWMDGWTTLCFDEIQNHSLINCVLNIFSVERLKVFSVNW